ncbi:MAG: hypothetical protein ACFCUP_05475 [Actinomycetales bacterium]
MTVRPFARPPLAAALTPYAARSVDPHAVHDVATLALLRWWSVSVADPGRVDPHSLPGFHRDFVSWWWSDPDNQLAVLVDEVGGATDVPIAMGWLVPMAALPRPDGDTRRPARVDGVYVVPGVVVPVVLDELHRALVDLAGQRGLVIIDDVRRP